jgi:ATP-dependent Clp protease ATP-binding subunit ClpC
MLRLVEDRLAEAMLAGEVKPGDTATLDLDDDGQVTIRTEQLIPVLMA